MTTRTFARRVRPTHAPVRHRKTVSASLALSLAVSGCVTSFGYYQENLKVKQVKGAQEWVPEYPTVKHWAYDVQDAFDTRATVNHYALEYGVLFSLAAAGTVAGLAIFDSSSAALQGIPIGTAFLSGAAAYYDNHYRYDMYSRASALVRALIDVGDERIMNLRRTGTPDAPAGTVSVRDLAIEARCLKAEVGHVIDLVRRHISLSDTKNLAAELGAINATVDQGKIADLVKAAQGDLSDLNIPDNLRESYCQKTGLLPGPLESPGPLITTTQTALISLGDSQFALDAAITAGQSELSRLKAQADDLARTKGEAAVKAARGKIDDVEKAIRAGAETKTKAAGVDITTAAGYIATLRERSQTGQSTIETAYRLFAERDRMRGLGQEATRAAAKIDAATRDAQAAIKTAQ